MKALTLTQPWASLVALGAKEVETRSWRTNYRGPLAIHAAKALPKSWAFMRDEHFIDALGPEIGLNEHGVPNIDRLPVGAVVCVVTVVDCIAMSTVPFDAVPGYSVTDQEAAFGHYDFGRFAWILEEPHPLEEPLPWRGAQGLWNIPALEVLG